MARSKKAFAKEVMTWMPVSLMNTYVERMVRLKGKTDWQARIMYNELYHRLMGVHGEIVRPEVPFKKLDRYDVGPEEYK